ncbi:chorismate mutase [Mycobacterium servetii]|uniref:Chorismate mutase n=1 Tax=Mycobacterium servetii TaxID=3237418 RepID=A0ABV4C740_9MYCO
MSLAEVRSQIDQIDEHIVRLLATRQKLVKEAALYKTGYRWRSCGSRLRLRR